MSYEPKLNRTLPLLLTGLEYGRYGVSKVLDTAYQGFLRVGTTFDIFQNILFPYSLNTAYCLLLDMAYWILFPSWSLVSAGTDRTKKPLAVPISTSEPKRTMNMPVATSHKKIVASDSIIQKYKSRLIEIIIFIVDSGCLKHMTGNLKLLINLMEKFLRTVWFETYSRIWRSGLRKRHNQGNDLLTVNHGSHLYTIELQESPSPTPICFMARASSSQAWLWHWRLSHMNFDTINLLSKKNIMNGLPQLKYVKDHLCSSCEMGKAKRNNLKSKDDTPEVLINFLRMIQRGLQAQNGVVERRNRTLIEASRTTLSAAKLPLFFWAEAIATACFTQNCSLIISRHEMTPYHIINKRKPDLKLLHIFGCTCYIVRDRENLDKMKEKVGESSSHYVEPSNMHQFYQRHPFEYQWMGDHRLEQVLGDPTKPVQTRRKLATDAKLCMFALTVSNTEPKNIKEAMADHAWIEAMQEKIHQFERFDV
ncbi:retrovirus-related pol polyprotein from transposon TNT 1-94 [Tanacetum coccineum]